MTDASRGSDRSTGDARGSLPQSSEIPVDPRFQRAHFLSAATSLGHAPTDAGFEVAFAGRSNAGKSSAINALCHQTRLARTSKTPGRTQQLIFFQLDEERRLVDLPGYGYAKVSLKIKAGWQASMGGYLQHRNCLRGLVLVMDIRHPLTEFDWQLIDWAEVAELPMLLLLTKSDKLKRGAIAKTLAEVRKATRDIASPVLVQSFSATKREGLTQAQARIADWLGF